MLVETFMVLLTMGSDGEIGGAFAVQASMEACENKLPAIVHTIEASNESGKAKIVESGCIAGEWPFAPFLHPSLRASLHKGRPTENAHYLIDFRIADKPVITPMLNKEACVFTKQKNGLTLHSKARDKLYCVISNQGWENPQNTKPKNTNIGHSQKLK